MATPKQTPPSPNAADLANAAYQKFVAKRDDNNRPVARTLDTQAPESKKNDDWLYPLRGKLNWLEQNKEAFALLDRATASIYYVPLIRNGEDEMKMFDRIGNARNLARYNRVRCEVYAAQGKAALAIDKALDLWKMGLEMQNNATLLGTLGGFAVEKFSRQPIDGNIAHLNSNEATRAAKRMEEMQAIRSSFKSMLTEERASYLATITPNLVERTREEIRETQRKAARERGDYNFIPEDKPNFRLLPPVINWSARKSAHEYDSAMQPLLASANRPWSQRQFQFPTMIPPQDRGMLHAVDYHRFTFMYNDVIFQIFMTRLALHAYRKTNGAYPVSLNQLAPIYLTKMPTDSFGDGKPLHYRREGRSYKLWSVGPDGRDDNAKPALSPSTIPQAQLLIAPDSQGDIVANINRY